MHEADEEHAASQVVVVGNRAIICEVNAADEAIGNIARERLEEMAYEVKRAKSKSRSRTRTPKRDAGLFMPTKKNV